MRVCAFTADSALVCLSARVCVSERANLLDERRKSSSSSRRRYATRLGGAECYDSLGASSLSHLKSGFLGEKILDSVAKSTKRLTVGVFG